MLNLKEQSGKISLSFFKKFLEQKSGEHRTEVRVGPGFGVDVSVVDLPNGEAMAMASDPLSLIPSLGLEESAWLSVCLIANDLCTTGVAPQYGQFVLNLPVDFSNHQFQIYWDYIHQFCKKMGIAITGGHTGFVEDQYSTIAGGGTFISIADKEKLLVSKGASPGDVILLTKHCGLSSAAILAMSFPTKIKNEVGYECYHTACDAFYDISVSKEAEAAVNAVEGRSITAMHDVTEGGVLGAIYELAFASGNGVEVNNEKLPVNAVSAAVCQVFDLDSRYCNGAGAMLIACKENDAEAVATTIKREGIPCVQIGKMTEQSAGMKLIDRGEKTNITYREKDPYWEAFYKAIKLGWK